MESMRALLLPIAQLLGVIAIAIALVAVLVGLLVALLRRLSSGRLFASYPLLVALRVLVGYRADRPTWRQRLIPVSSQNFIAMVGTAIGVWALVVVLSVMGGFEADLKGKIVRHSPHVTIVPTLDMAAAGGDDRRVAALAGTLAGLRDVAAAEAYVEGEAMVTSPMNMSPGMAIRGVRAGGALEALWLGTSADPDALRALANPVLAMSDRELGFAEGRDEGVTGTGTDTGTGTGTGTGSGSGTGTGAAGDTDDDADEAMPEIGVEDDADDDEMPEIGAEAAAPGRVIPGILLGEELANSLSIGIGDEVMAVIPDGDVGPTGVRPMTRTFRVSGTFASGMYEHDLKSAYVTLDEAKRLFLLGTPNRIAVMLDDIDRLDAAVPGLRDALDRAGGGTLRTVAQVNRSLFSALLVEKIAMFLVLGLVILVAAFNVFGSLVLITMEKTRDIAVLRSVGATRAGVRGIFLALGGVIGAVGVVAGLILGLGTCAYIAWAGIPLPSEYYLRELPVAVRPLEVALVTLAALGAGLLATLYPANTVAARAPSEGLRND